MISIGGERLRIRKNVIYSLPPIVAPNETYAEVQNLSGGAMVFKSEAREDFTWDPQFARAFDDLDKSMQIWMSDRWKQAIIPRAKLTHDFTRSYQSNPYASVRYDWVAIRESYRLFRKKWNLRLDMKRHLLYEVVNPTLVSLPTKAPLKLLSEITGDRTMKRLARVNGPV